MDHTEGPCDVSIWLDTIAFRLTPEARSVQAIIHNLNLYEYVFPDFEVAMPANVAFVNQARARDWRVRIHRRSLFGHTSK